MAGDAPIDWRCCMLRRKMAARVSELEDSLEQARTRAGKLEKERNRLQLEIHEVVTELEQVTPVFLYLLIYLLT